MVTLLFQAFRAFCVRFGRIIKRLFFAHEFFAPGADDFHLYDSPT